MHAYIDLRQVRNKVYIQTQNNSCTRMYVCMYVCMYVRMYVCLRRLSGMVSGGHHGGYLKPYNTAECRQRISVDRCPLTLDAMASSSASHVLALAWA